MSQYMLFYYDGNEHKVCLSFAKSMVEAGVALQNSGKIGDSAWEEAILYVVDFGYLAPSDISPVQVFNNAPGVGRFFVMSEIEVLGEAA